MAIADRHQLGSIGMDCSLISTVWDRLGRIAQVIECTPNQQLGTCITQMYNATQCPTGGGITAVGDDFK